MITDAELLSRYAEQKAEAAFAELVRRHLNLVYSAALRQVSGDAHLAKDVTQTVFNDLARKSGALKNHAVLTGWLYTSARFAAAQAMRAARRRQKHEQEAFSMHENSDSTISAAEWERLQPVLDEVMHELGDRDREAVLLRFFEGAPFGAVGEKLGLSEEAARKRVSRALDELRGALEKRGVTSTAAALSGILLTRAVTAAPVGFGAVVTAGAVSGTAAVGGGTGAIWEWLTTTKALGSAIAAVVVAGGVVVGLGALRNQDLRGEIEAWHGELAKLTAASAAEALPTKVRWLEAELVTARQATAVAAAAVTVTATAAALPDSRSEEQRRADAQASDPEAQERRRLLSRTALDRSYAGMFRRLALPTDTLTRLISLMLDREDVQQEAFRLARAQGVAVDAKGAAEALTEIATAEVLGQIRELLGAEKFAYYQTYRTTLPFRYPITDLAEQFRGAAHPLTDEMVDRLVSRIAAAFPDVATAFDGGGFVIPELVVEQMAAVLTPEQVAALKTIQAAQRAGREMVEMNREAATKGLIRLNGQSLKDYPPPPGSPASDAPLNERYADFTPLPGTSFVTITFKQENAVDALSLYRRLAGVELEIAPEIAAAARTVTIEIIDAPPTAALMLLRQALLNQAGIAITLLNQQSGTARLVTPTKS